MNGSYSEDDVYDLAEELGYAPHLKNIARSKKTVTKPRPARPVPPPPATVDLEAQQDDTFTMSYHAGRHEAIWLEESLQDFFTQQWFNDVLRVVKGGKEASVYLCAGNKNTGRDLIAAKVYRPRRFRNLKNDWVYREGRDNLDSSGHLVKKEGELRAIRQRTDFGRELMHTSWLMHEYLTLKMLHKAGADVPEPYASSDNALLMEYFGDEVMGAPTLNDVTLPFGEAVTLFDRVLKNIDLMLSKGIIHGDLSAFNILYWEGKIVIIDFPQAIHPEQNNLAYPIFERDINRICEYFARCGVRSNSRKLAANLWQGYDQPFIPRLDPKIIDDDKDDERDIWESLKNSQ